MLNASGLFAPLPSCFTDDGSSVSEIRLARLVHRLHRAGVQGFVLGSDLGEFGTLSMSERKSLVEIVMRETKNDGHILVHVSTLSTADSLDLAQHAQRHGARGVVMMPPFYGHLTAAEMATHFKSIGKYSQLEVVVVDPLNVFSRAVTDLLAPVPGLYQATTYSPVGRPVFSRASSDEFKSGELVVSPYATLFPEQPLYTIEEEAIELLRDLMIEYSPTHVVKEALTLMDSETGPARAPIQSLPQEAFDRLRRALKLAAPA